MKRDMYKTYTKDEALQAVMSGSELHHIALRAALRKFNEKGGEK